MSLDSVFSTAENQDDFLCCSCKWSLNVCILLPAQAEYQTTSKKNHAMLKKRAKNVNRKHVFLLMFAHKTKSCLIHQQIT